MASFHRNVCAVTAVLPQVLLELRAALKLHDVGGDLRGSSESTTTALWNDCA